MKLAETLGVLACICVFLITSNSIVLAESVITETGASTLSNYGLIFVVDTDQLINSSKKTDVPAEVAENIGTVANNFARLYHERVVDAMYGANILHAKDISKTIGDVKLMSSEYIENAFPDIALNAATGYSNSKVHGYIIDDAVGKCATILMKSINSMSNDERNRLDMLIRHNKIDDAIKFINGENGVIKNIKSKLDQNDNYLYNSKIIDNTIQSVLINGSLQSISTLANNELYRNVSEGDFVNHIKVMGDFTVKTAKAFRGLNDSAKLLKSGVDVAVASLNDFNLENATVLQIQTIQDLLHGDLSPSAKLAVLSTNNVQAILSEGQQRVLRGVVNTQVRQQELLINAVQVVGYANNLNDILNSFGVHDNRLTKAVQYGNVASAALQQGMSGNFIGAALSVSGLFGKGAADPVQNELDNIFSSLAGIDAKLDDVIKLQKDTLIAIEKLSSKLDEIEKQMNKRFDNLDFELSRINAGVQSLMWSDINYCDEAWSSRNGYDSLGKTVIRYDDLAKRFVSFRDMKKFIGSHGDQVSLCQNTLLKLFVGMKKQNFTGNPISLKLVADAVQKNKVLNGIDGVGEKELQEYIEKFHKPSFDFLQKSWAEHNKTNPHWGDLSTAFAMLTTPSPTASDLRGRIRYLNSIQYQLNSCSLTESMLGARMKDYLCADSLYYDSDYDANNGPYALKRAENFLREPIARDQIGVLTMYSCLVAGAGDLAKGACAQEPRDINEIVDGQFEPRGREVLHGALMVSDVSIAQQAMIYGDLTAWFVFEQLWDNTNHRFVQNAQSDNPELFHYAQSLLRESKNPWLQRNVLMLILQSAEKNHNSEAGDIQNSELLYELMYKGFLKSENDDNLKLAAKNWFSILFDISHDVVIDFNGATSTENTPRRLMFNLDGYALPMPLVKDWKNKMLVYPPMMDERLRDQAILARRLADYTVFDQMSDSDKFNLIRITTKGAH